MWHFMKKLWKSVPEIFHSITGKHRSSKKKIYLGSKALTATSWKFTRLFLVRSPIYPDNFMLIRSTVSHNVVYGHGFPRKCRKQSCVQGIKWNILKVFQMVSCTKSHIFWKFSWKSIQPFFRNVANKRRDKHTNKQTNSSENITFAVRRR